MRINRFPWGRCITAVFLLALPAVVQAQFTYTTNNNSITIIGYTGAGGAVEIPGTTNGYAVTGIGDYAFAYSTSLTSVSIPSSVTNIGVEVFVGCASLTNIGVNSGNPSFTSMNGVLFDSGKDTLVEYPGGLTNGTYTIPDSVTSIGQYAFASCFRLTNISIVTFQANLKTIGDFAFSDCTGLTSITLTNWYIGFTGWVGPTSIGAGAFTYCTSLRNVVIAGTITNLGGLAFAFCTNLTSAYFLDNAPPDIGNTFYDDPDAVVYYEPGTTNWGAAFGGAPTVEETPPFAFEYTTNDGSITIEQYSRATTISFNGAVVIPAIINGYSVTSIGGFGGNNYVTTVTIPDSVTNIGEEAFDDCVSLTNIVIPGSVISIGNFAFQGCTSLSSVIAQAGVTSIGENAFDSCTSLSSVTLPDSVTTIGEQAFYSCASLTSVVIPNSVTSIAQGAFQNCTGLTNVTIGSSVTNMEDAFEDCSSLASVTFANGIITIPSDALEGCESLTGVTLPDSVTSIGDYAFSQSGLTSIAIPNGVTNIAEFAFNGCHGLTSVTIPGGVIGIGYGAFADCSYLKSAYFDGNAPTDVGNAFSPGPAIVYYLPGTTGWGATFGGVSAELWNPQTTSFITAGNQFGFGITGPTNATIVVEACTNLVNPVWLPVSTNTLSGSGTSSFSDSQGTNFPSRYYRFSAP